MEKENKTMLQAVDEINKAAKGASLDNQFVLDMHETEKIISDKLGISDTQSMLMAFFVNHTFDLNVNLQMIFDGTNCSTSRKLELTNDIDWLIDNHYILKVKDHWDNMSFKLPIDVINAFRHNEAYVRKGYGKVSLRSMFFILEDLFTSREKDEITYDHLSREVNSLFNANADNEFVRKLRSLNFAPEDAMMLVLFCHLFVNNGDDNIGWHDLKFLYDRSGQTGYARAGLLGDSHVLIMSKIIEHSNAGGFVNKESFKLSEKTKRELLGELKIKSVDEGKDMSDVIKHKDIKFKQLFFPLSVKGQVDELQYILQEKNYKNVCKRMKEKGFHSGFACLFYGSPGTGKTETVYQLAKSTGRDVMLVDIPEIRSKWVGESEKNVKGIFERYAGLVKDSKRTPILLFNEADAIINKRSVAHDTAVDKMENTMQNIILQEMENLQGILIATTNLQTNMDKAFERRFLYKIQFEKPNLEARANIWHSMIPDLDKSVINSLASKYDFSGGQIENIARHYTIETIIKGEKRVTQRTLERFCDQESIKKDNHRIGFKL